MRSGRSRWAAAAAVAVLGACAGCSGGSADPDDTAPRSPTTTVTTTVTPTAEPTAGTGSAEPDEEQGTAASSPRGLVYYAGRRARTGEWQLVAEQSGLRGRADLLAATTRPPTDPDYRSLWSGDVVDRVRLLWDGDEGYYSVRLRDEAATRRPAGMSLREAHLAIQQVVWTLDLVGRVPAPVRFSVARSDEPVTDLLGVPATGPSDTYLAADHAGVLSSMNILAPADGAAIDGTVEVSGLAESFEATVGIRVAGPGGEVVVDDSTQAEQCCGRLFPWTYSLDTTGWTPGAYTVSALTDDPVGIAQGSDGPEIDTKVITVR